MNTKQSLSILIALLIGCAIGRFSLPSKIIETENKQLDKDTSKEDHTITIVTEVHNVDGTVTKTTRIQNDIDTDSKSKLVDDKSKEVTYDTRRWTIAGLALTKPLSGLHPPITYGGEVMYRILGPIQVGVLGTADGTMGVALGISF